MFFTQARINNLTASDCPAGQKEKLFFDEGTLGLLLRLTKSGGKSYLQQYTFKGRRTRRPLGNTRAISLAQAKATVHVTHGDIASGIDPGLRHKSAISATTLAGLIEDWRALHLNSRRARYAAEAIRTLRRTFARYLDEPAEELGRPAIIGVIDALSRDGHNAMASATVAYGRSCYGWALRRGAVKINPFENLPVTSTVRRERVLTDEELTAI